MFTCSWNFQMFKILMRSSVFAVGAGRLLLRPCVPKVTQVLRVTTVPMSLCDLWGHSVFCCFLPNSKNPGKTVQRKVRTLHDSEKSTYQLYLFMHIMHVIQWKCDKKKMLSSRTQNRRFVLKCFTQWRSVGYCFTKFCFACKKINLVCYLVC